jgi:hypothetical protein
MKTLLILAVGAVALYQAAKRYNINSVGSLKKSVMPYLKELGPHMKGMVPHFEKVLAN